MKLPCLHHYALRIPVAVASPHEVKATFKAIGLKVFQQNNMLLTDLYCRS